jgi:hypothetical protein
VSNDVLFSGEVAAGSDTVCRQGCLADHVFIMHERLEAGKYEVVALGTVFIISRPMMQTSRSGAGESPWKQQDEDKIIKIRSVRSECTRDIKGTRIIFFSPNVRTSNLVAPEPIKLLRRRWGC